ncbi:protein NLRC3-like isoform X3 [Thrips palmi]|uniref:Protein NLRC3-like isoform X3 n=1 Tax=Thrips palmi TaxID=161013 RepID=A0A6P8YMC2_THRPL|nr:protein NLRC3-like isoform X3 [Thrips palmi]
MQTRRLKRGSRRTVRTFYGVRSRTLRAIAQALMYNPTVHTLDLTGNWMSPEAAYYMAELLLRENIALQHLIMKGCNLNPRAAVMLAEGVELNHTLQTLVLADNHLGDDGVLSLQEALAVNDKLQILDLSNNHLGAVAASSLAKALQENQTIEVLRLAGNNLYEDTAKGLQTLLRVIQKREKPIQVLDLAWNALNVPAAVPLRVFLVRSAVQQLFLNNNRFPGPAIDTIKVGVAKSKTLQHLKIGFNPMEPHNALNLLHAAQASSTLQTLDLDGIRVHTDFIKVQKRLEESRGMEITIEGTLSDYEIKGPNLKEMMLKRARFEGFKPKRKKRKKDFGHLLLQLAENGIETMLPEQFTEAAMKKKKIKIREELLRALYEEFKAKKSWVDVTSMLECYMKLFPDTVLPPPVLKKKKRKGKKKKKKSKKTK